MYIVYDTESGWSEDSWRFGLPFEAEELREQLNEDADYDHYAIRWEG